MHRLFQTVKPGLFCAATSNYHGVPSGTRRRIANYLSQTTLDFIPHNRIPHPFAGYKAKPTLIRAVREHTKNQQVIGCTASILVNLRNSGPAGKPGTSLHASAENGAKQAGKRER
jgi:hypothetical protein